MEAYVKAINVSKPLESYNGVKVMIYQKDVQGDQSWINDNNVYLYILCVCVLLVNVLFFFV